MVKNSLFYAAILLVVYTIGVHYIPFERNIPLNVQQSKYLTVENFLYGQQKNNMPFSVIVGSSMAEKLSTNRLPTSVINLSMNGGMSLTGLQLLEKSKRIPVAIYVELNVLTRKEDSTLLACFDNTWLQKQKEILPFLQERNQPATILLNAYNVVRPVTKKRPIVSTQVLTNVQAKHLETKNDTNSFQTIRKNILLLQSHLEKYIIKGTKIHLFRMPVEQSTQAILNQTARVQFERKLIAQLLVPISQIHLIHEDLQHVYHTTDGVHLTKDDADYFVSYLLNLSAGQK